MVQLVDAVISLLPIALLVAGVIIGITVLAWLALRRGGQGGGDSAHHVS